MDREERSNNLVQFAASESIASTKHTQSKVIVVLGMHRSGTSLCMNVLNELGVRLDADLISANEHNERGFFESRAIMHLNEQIFRVLGITWHTLFSTCLNEDWVDRPELANVKQELACLLKERNYSKGGLWGFKDPRLCFLLPLYEQIFAEQQVKPFYVVCTRNPGAIASSLQRRNGFPRILSELLWMENTVRAIQGAGTRLKAVVDYETWFEHPIQEAQRLAAALELDSHAPDRLSEAHLRDLVVCGLDHSGGCIHTFELQSTEKVYRLLGEGRYSEAADELSEVQRGVELGIFPPVALCQLFWRTAQQDHFTEANSVCVYTDNLPRPRVVRLEVPRAQDLTGLRLDPSDSPGTATLLSIKVLNPQNRVIWKWTGDSETLLNWESQNITLGPQIGKRGVAAQFLTDESWLMIPLTGEVLQEMRNGGAVEFEFVPGGESWPLGHGNLSVLKSSDFEGTIAQNDLLKLQRVLTTKSPRPKAGCQLFWRTTNSNFFTEVNSCSVYHDIAPGKMLVSLPIHLDARPITGLRLDPSSEPGLARILSIRLLNANSEPIWGWDGAPGTILKWQSSNLTLLSQLGERGVLAHFQTHDPTLILPVPQSALNDVSGEGGIVEFGFEWIGSNQPDASDSPDHKLPPQGTREYAWERAPGPFWASPGHGR